MMTRCSGKKIHFHHAGVGEVRHFLYSRHVRNVGSRADIDINPVGLQQLAVDANCAWALCIVERVGTALGVTAQFRHGFAYARPKTIYRSRTRRSLFARETQGHIRRCRSRSAGDSAESLCSGSPSRTLTAQVLQVPAWQP